MKNSVQSVSRKNAICRKAIRSLSVVLSVGHALTASAADLTVANHSFESPVLTDGQYNVNNTPGWAGTGTFYHVANPTDAWFTGTSQNSAGPNPIDGTNIAGINNDTRLYQDLSATFLPEHTYTLTVLMGTRIGVPFGVPKVRLISAGTTVAELLPSAPPSGTFQQTSLTYTSPASGPVIGTSIRIEFQGLGGSAQFWIDNVRLSATPIITPPPPPPATYNLARDFSRASNPNGVWSYGAKSNIAGVFTPLSYARAGIPESWEFLAGVWPAIYRNNSSNNVISDGGQGVFPPNSIWLAAGENGTPRNFGVIRFTVPPGAGGDYRIETRSRSGLVGPISSDADFRVARNGVELFGVNRPASSSTWVGYSNALALAAGDTIDLLVGRGNDGSQPGSILVVEGWITALTTNTPPPPPPPPAGVYDLAGGFSSTSNPNGPWAYGWKGTLAGMFTALTVPHVSTADGGQSIPSWQLTSFQTPAVYKNISGVIVTAGGGTATFPPGTVWYYPGENGRPENLGVIRFTVPAGGGGNYDVRVAVAPVYNGSPQGDTDFHVARNGVELFGQNLPAGARTGYTNILALNASDTVDFAIGRGLDGNQFGSGLKIAGSLSLVTNTSPPSCQPVTAPAVFATTDAGNGSGLLRFPIRLQEVYGASHFGTQAVVIRELRLRPSAPFGSAFSATMSNLQIRLSTTAKVPEGLSSIFASNVGPDEVTVFNGSLAVSSAFTGPAAGPKDFDIVFPLTTPFVYDPAQGNLLVDWRNVAGSTATFVDAGQAPGDGASRAFALGAGSTVATTVDGGAEVIRFCYTPTNRPPVTNPPPPVVACNAESLAVPAVFANVEAGGGTSVLRDAIRLQEVYGAGQFPTNPIVIRQIRWRPSAIFGSAFTGTISNLQINLSTTVRQPDGLSATFAQNVGTNDTVVFSGPVTMTSAFAGPAGGPKAFDMVVPLTTPFIYDPARGNLLVDVRNHSGGPVAFVDGNQHPNDLGSRAFALGAGSTQATTVDSGVDVLQFCYTPTNRPPVTNPPPPVVACNAESLPIPAVLAGVEGGGGSSVLRNSIRLQEVYAGSQFPALPMVIHQLRWRPSALFGQAFSATISNLQVNLSTTARQPDGLSALFAENVGSNDTVVFSGPITLSSAFTGPANGPKAWDIVVPLTTPFLYDPAAGNLLVDIRNHSGSLVTFVDAGQAAGDGASRAFALGSGSTTATTRDSGADVIQLCFSPTNRPPPPPPTNCIAAALPLLAELIEYVSSLAPDVNTRPLLASLLAAQASFERGSLASAIGQLHAFQNKTRAQVGRRNPALADELIARAQAIIDAANCPAVQLAARGLNSFVRIESILPDAQSGTTVAFLGVAGSRYEVQVSENLVDWRSLGFATEIATGVFQHLDSGSSASPSRFYRVAPPAERPAKVLAPSLKTDGIMEAE